MGIFSKKSQKEEIAPVQVINEHAAVTTKSSLSSSMHARRVLLQVHTSEKIHKGSGGAQTYAFVVNDHATKPMIKKAVESRYGVHVDVVRVTRRKGKARFYHGKISQRSIMKKAVVTLKVGEHIDLT